MGIRQRLEAGMVPAAQAATQIGSILLICNGTNCQTPISNNVDGVYQRR